MFVWSSSASPVSDVFGGGAGDNVATEQSEQGAKEIRMVVSDQPRKSNARGSFFFFFFSSNII
jgi:auxin efflux carrier family